MRTKVIKHPNTHLWRLWGYVPAETRDARKRVARSYATCCWLMGGDQRCGKIAFYRIKFSGFCESHKAEAYEAQRQYWQRKFIELNKQYYEKILRRDHV